MAKVDMAKFDMRDAAATRGGRFRHAAPAGRGRRIADSELPGFGVVRQTVLADLPEFLYRLSAILDAPRRRDGSPTCQ